MQGSLDPAQLGEAQIASFAHHPAAQVAAVHAQGVVGAIADIGIGFAAAFHVSADAAVPQQVDRRLQDGRHQFAGRQRFDIIGKAQRIPHLRRDGDGLGTARMHATTGADQPGVVIGPAGAR